MKNTNETDAGPSERGFTREELIRRGAQDLIQKAIEVEVQALLASFEKVRLLGGRRAVVRNGYLPERDILTPMGEIPVRIPKVRDRIGNGVKFDAALVSIQEVIRMFKKMLAATVVIPVISSAQPVVPGFQQVSKANAPWAGNQALVIGETLGHGAGANTVRARAVEDTASYLPVKASASWPAVKVAASRPIAVSSVPTDSGALVVPAATQPPAVTPTYRAESNIPPRIQWNANFGYCGETSFVSAGLNFGQYISQYDARAIASRNARQHLESSQLLLGVNDVAVAKAMHLTGVAKQAASPSSFLPWVKLNVVAGFPVIIGVFMNQSRFYGTTNLKAGDNEYDHIVTVTGVTSTHPLTGPATYYANDTLTLTDHGVWSPGGLPQNTFTYPFASLPATRQQANAKTGPVYSLKNGTNYGIAITGIIDLSRETVPVRLTTSTNAEIPAMINGSNTRPKARPLTLTATVSNLKPGNHYNLYRYSSMAAVPDSNINANAANAAQKWTIKIASGSSYTMTQTIMSNEIAVYRAVPVGAP